MKKGYKVCASKGKKKRPFLVFMMVYHLIVVENHESPTHDRYSIRPGVSRGNAMQ